MRRLLFLVTFFSQILICFGQSINNTWFLGTDTGFPMGKLVFTPSSYNLFSQQYKMSYKGTQATISDITGNFLMSSNGVWIANANNDTLLNGGGLNPGANVNSNPKGLLNPYANVFLPYPGDSNKYVLIHHTHEWDGYSYPSYDVFESIVDITLDGGLGAVTSKNQVVFSDTMNWGFGACKHANGRDWWIVASKHDSNKIFKLLYTPNGVESITSQSLNVPVAWYNVTHLDFSPNGSKFAYSVYDSVSLNNSLLLFDFDRCSGTISHERIIQLTTSSYIWGLSFSPTGNFVYSCSANEVFQIDTNTLSVDTVAVYDGFCFPNPPWCTSFMFMYLAANGKIYITSGNAVQHIHEMNYPDSAGIACDVQQHSINLNGIWYFRAVPNHPNYYLGPLNGSSCDTLGLGIQETNHDFHFTVSPNPVSGNFKISYLLPQNQKGRLEILDVNGHRVYEMNLPQWSTMQIVTLPKDICSGVYGAVLSSGGEGAYKKLVLIKE